MMKVAIWNIREKSKKAFRDFELSLLKTLTINLKKSLEAFKYCLLISQHGLFYNVFCLISLFNGISAVVFYLIPKPTL